MADPVRERRAVELDALAGQDLALPVERQVVGVFADQDVGHQGLGRQPALDQSRRCRRLHHRAFAGAAAIFRPAGDDHLELRRDDVEALRDVLADPVQRAATAGTDLLGRLDHDLFAWQVLRQRAAIDTPLLAARRLQRRVGLLFLHLGFGERLLEVLEGQLQLIAMDRLLGAPAEQARCSCLTSARSCSLCPASLAAVARSASSRAWSVATSSGNGAAAVASGEGLIGPVDHTPGV